MVFSSESGVVDPASRDKYLLQVTAGSSYDTSTHDPVSVNGSEPLVIENDLITCYLKVRIRDYNGLPRGSPSTCSYFDHPTHKSDRYSIEFSFIPKKDIKGEELVFGFDFDHSVKDRLPPGFKYAMKIVTTVLDPGIYADPYSDNPYLYGPALSSFFAFRIGEHTSATTAEIQFASNATGVIEEGAHGSGSDIRSQQNIPPKGNKRRKHFLYPAALEDFTFEAGRLYQADFFNPYLDFANFSLRIPGFSISVVKYIDDKTHQLRFVMKNRKTEEIYFVLVFTLLFGQKLDETLKKEDKAGSEPEKTKTTSAGMGRTQTPSLPRGRSETPVKDGKLTPSTLNQSRSPSASTSGSEDEERATVSRTLASSIYSSFAMLGFGRTASSSEASTPSSSEPVTPERETGKSLDRRVDDMGNSRVEDYLRSKQNE
ncbi:DUF1769-domain-containing protein [Amniculicola lignicola CBS 123094]|uniref:DUF1769-domain-containing protein n=1 Tax=Amniculicola lignicola CBS 123094 TaxID=1392246 RepID=A0A6A5W327_9PLEO|nr:DUF1769-domain-containing protein [Amniculicola lignicola CBS 123094]